jgi:hypothetical protein
VFKKPKEHNLYAKFKKCKVYVHEVAILKHKIIKIRLQMDDEKVRVFLDWELPRLVLAL